MIKRFIPLFFISAPFISSCDCNNFDKVKVGHSTKELIEIVGEPDSIRDDFFNKVYFYKTHLVSVENDTVRNINSIAQIKAEMMNMQHEINKIRGLE